MNAEKKSQIKGFTLIESLVALTIFILIGAAALPAYRNFQKESDLINTAEEVLSVLRLAQSKTTASQQDSQWGVHFSASDYVLFKGDDYALRDNSFDKTYDVPDLVEINEIDLEGGASEVIFERITGYTTQYGNLSLRLKADTSQSKAIVIEPSGQIFSQQAVASDTERVKDSRRVHFNYSRSINTSLEIIALTFTYDSSSVIENISVSDNIKNNQIFWEGEVTVNNQVQKLKIHTIYLNDPVFDTVFCVHRDQRYNDFALQVELSGDSTGDLINYDPVGQTTQGSSIYVSAPAWQ